MFFLHQIFYHQYISYMIRKIINRQKQKAQQKSRQTPVFFQQNKHYLTNKIKSRLLPAFYTFILSVFQPNQTTGYGLQSSMLYALPHHDVPIFLQKHPILWIFSFQYHEPFVHQLF